ncbi:MAG TPA: NAD-dependent epimerase/dehydratase family protein [Gemmatimonadales bacterium]
MNRTVAVTGATGRIGAPLVDALLRAGREVRALSRRAQTPRAGVEWIVGDLLDAGAVATLIAGAETVFHAGGQLQGRPEAIEHSLVQGTENVLRAARDARLVHVSSLVVVDTASAASPRVIDENSPLEPFPGRRGSYTRGKSAAEALVREGAAAGRDVVIVRPGLVISPADAAVPLSIGVRMGRAIFFVGPRQGLLPVVHAEDVASGMLCAATGLERGELLHLIDPLPVTRAALFRRIVAGTGHAYAVPTGAASLLLARSLAGRRGRSPMADAAYRLLSAGNPHQWSTGRGAALGWRPGALRRWFAAEPG